MRPLLSLALSLVALAAAARPGAPERAGEAATGIAPPAVVRAALEGAIDEPGARAALELLVECARDGRLPALVVYGRGVGIWDGRRQLALSPETVQALLVALRDGGFAELRPTYGGRAAAPELRPPNRGAAAVQVTCRLRLAFDGWSKQVVQLEQGEQSAELARLADALYALAAPAVATGVEATSLEDGLEKIARGELAAETWSAVLHRKPELGASATIRAGFLLRIEGRTARSQPFSPESGYGPERTLVLGEDDLAELALALAAERPGRLPANLWAPDYNDLSLEVLGHRVALQARRFTGMTSSTHGEPQRAFDGVAAELARLAERIAREGEAVDER